MKCVLCKRKRKPTEFTSKKNKFCNRCNSGSWSSKRLLPAVESKDRKCLGHDCDVTFLSIIGERFCPKCTERNKEIDADEFGFVH